MNVVVNILVFVFAAVAMEWVAWALHKYVMHGFLWVLHEDHHRSSPRRLQKNDLFALFFAGLSFGFIYGGLANGIEPLTAAGFGVTLYGVCYFAFHDFMYHRRIKALVFKPRSQYFKNIINAHRVHHRVTTKENSLSFGFLYAPKKYSSMRVR